MELFLLAVKDWDLLLLERCKSYCDACLKGGHGQWLGFTQLTQLVTSLLKQ